MSRRVTSTESREALFYLFVEKISLVSESQDRSQRSVFEMQRFPCTVESYWNLVYVMFLTDLEKKISECTDSMVVIWDSRDRFMRRG